MIQSGQNYSEKRFLARLMNDADLILINAFPSPYLEDRDDARKITSNS